MLKHKLMWDGFQLSLGTLVMALVVVAAAVCIFMLLKYERRLVPKKVGYTLLVLRFVVLGVVLIMLLEPVLRWTFDRNRSGRILVAIDLSESMTTADSHAGKAEKLRWARAMGMIGNEKTNDRIDAWIKAYQQDKEPEWVGKDEAGSAAGRQELARSRKENLEGIFREIDRLSRKEIALRLLSRGSEPLLKKLQEVGTVDVVAFAGEAETLNPETLEGAVRTPPATLRADASDLAAALTTGTGDDEDTRVIGVVLLTDGRDNVGRDAVRAAARLGQLDAPVYPVIMGSVLKPTDISIGYLKFPETAFKNDTPQLKAQVNTSGFEGRELTIVLERDGGEPQTKKIKPDGPEATVVFDLDAAKVGRKKYRLRVDVQKGETRDDNNAKDFAINIVDDKVRVLLVEGEARWEFRFIDNALVRDERVETRRVVFRQPYLGILERTFFPRKLDLPQRPDDLENSPFAEPDLVIVGDVDATEMPEKGWKLLERFVGEAGGTLVMVAGKEHFPYSHRSETLQALLPVKDLRPLNVTGPSAQAPPVERGFHLRLTPEGQREPMFQFEDDPRSNEEAWAGLPGHTWGLLGEAKKGTTVYAYAVEPGKPQTLQQQRRSAVIVQRHYGFGQVLWIGIDSTWRWRYRLGDKYHHRFWGQIGRWAANNKASAGNEFVKFGPERSDIETGEDAVIRARWSKKFLHRFPNLKAKVQVFKLDDKAGRPALAAAKRKLFTTLDLKPDESRPLVQVARGIGLPSGRYKVRLLAPGVEIEKGTPIEADLVVHDRLSKELQDLSSNRALLARLAEVSRGRLLLPDEARQLPSLFLDPDADRKFGEENTIWDKWWVLVLFFALLTGEWVVRKLNGLP